MVLLKRAYEPAGRRDGERVLVERLWPRGVRKEELELDWWAKDVAPSTALRKWFAHDPERWPEFVRRYRAELRHPDAARALAEIVDHARSHTVTLVYSTHDTEHNNAVVLKQVIDRVLRSGHSPHAPAP
jgi:uncharacterized protein YeaO (DUF488 family)